MSALYPLRVNSEYQSEIEQLESMGFNGNEAVQYLEENEGNVVRTLEQLLQNESGNEAENEPESEEEQDGGQEPVEANNNNNNNNNINSYFCNLNETVDEIIKDFCKFCKDVSFDMVCSKFMLFVWCIIIIIIPIIISIHHHHHHHHHNHHNHNKRHNNESITDPLRAGYVYITNDGKYLSVDVSDANRMHAILVNVSPKSTNDNLAMWYLEIHADAVKLKNKFTQKYLRIRKNKVDGNGNGGKWTSFRLHNLYPFPHSNEMFSVSLESDKTPNVFLSQALHAIDSKFVIEYVNDDAVQPNPHILREFGTVYDFEDDVLFVDDDVIIKHVYYYDAYMQLKSKFSDDVISKNEIKSEGGIWKLQRIKDEREGNGMILVKLMNKWSGKYLRIMGNKVSAGGSGGKYTLFSVTLVGAQNDNLQVVRLESAHFAGKYIAIRRDGSVDVTDNCDGDIDCVLMFVTKQRSKDLINLKSELKIIRLEQEIAELKENEADCWDEIFNK